MADQQQHLIIPPHDQVYTWWEEACKRPPSSFYEKLDSVAEQAAEWGWQQRDASVPGELQEARDEELEECVKWLSHESPFSERLRAARRPKPPSLAEEALEAQSRMWAGSSTHDDWELVRAALKRLQELEGQGDG